MAIHAAAVGILIEKGRFEPEVALGIAEAIEATMTHAQLVTIPILDARLHEFRAEMRVSLMALESKLDAGLQELRSEMLRLESRFESRLEQTKAELVRWVFLTMLGNVALSAAATALLNAFRHIG
jgi:hypothetical protein